MLPFTLHQLRILKAIATEKNFTNAAKILHISQPALSKQLKNMENSLKIILVNRNKNNITLTHYGKFLLDYADRILTLCEETCRALNALSLIDRSNLTIGLGQSLENYIMPKTLIYFAQKNPKIDLNIQIQPLEVNIKKVQKEELDLAIIGSEISDKFKQKLNSEAFGYDKLSLVVPKSYPLPLKKEINKTELYKLNFITFNSNSNLQESINNILIQNQIEPKRLKIILEVNSIEAIKTAVSSGLGVAFVSSSLLEKEVDLKQFKVLQLLNISLKRKLFIISNLKTYKSKAFKLIVNHIKKSKT